MIDLDILRKETNPIDTHRAQGWESTQDIMERYKGKYTQHQVKATLKKSVDAGVLEKMKVGGLQRTVVMYRAKEIKREGSNFPKTENQKRSAK